MSGETEKDVSGWTTDTLHSHVQQLLRLMQDQIDRRWDDERRAVDIALRAHDEALKVAAETSKEAITAALAAQKEAVLVAQTASDQRLHSMNEWRKSLNDLATLGMPRSEAEAAITRAIEAIHEVRMTQQTLISRSEYDTARLHEGERLTSLTNRVTQVEAMARGAQASRGAIISALGVATSLIVAVIIVLNFITKA